MILEDSWNFDFFNSLFNVAAWPKAKPQDPGSDSHPFIFEPKLHSVILRFHDAESELIGQYRSIASLVIDHSLFPPKLSAFTKSLTSFRELATKPVTPIKSFFNSRLAFPYWQPEFDPAHTKLRAAPAPLGDRESDDLSYKRHVANRRRF
jgi:hypothetical protein